MDGWVDAKQIIGPPEKEAHSRGLISLVYQLNIHRLLFHILPFLFN